MIDQQSNAEQDLLATLHARGRQYGSEDDDKANLRYCEVFGVDPLTGVFVRMGDKWARLVNLTVALRTGESINPVQLRDTLLDLAGYSVKAMELLDERFGPSVAAYPDESDSEPESPVRRGLRSVFGR